ncbi:MAG: trypsin-like serine protease [Bacteroidales bacterium]|nr:trypsin-like serine protease [Bacteroidales bacterium]
MKTSFYSIFLLASLLMYASIPANGQGSDYKSIYPIRSSNGFHDSFPPGDSVERDLEEESKFIDSFYEDFGWRSGRIVGGGDANIEDYPWHVALISTSGTQFCAGTVLGENWILTAAHCGTPNRIRAGVTNRTDLTGQDRFIIQKINHPNYSPYSNDVSLIQLASPLDLSGPNVKAIPIITQAHADDGYTDPGVMAVITGWGALSQGGPSSNILQFAQLPIVSNEDAMTIGGYAPGAITDDMLCAGFLGTGGIDACQGDSGGPLVVADPGSELGFSVAGVTSWGFGCAQPLYPGVWARVSYFEDWISMHTGLSWDGPVTLPNPNSISAESAGLESIEINWVNNPDDDDVLLVWSDSYLIGSPEAGQTYNAGETLPGGGTVLFSGSANAFVHSGLSQATRYYYKIWAWSEDHEYSIGKVAAATTDCPVYTLPFTETFEDSSGTRNCWTQITETGNKRWSFASGAGGGQILTAHNGDKNARFTSTSGGPWITKLVSPVLNFNNYENIILSFWYGQESWSGDQNELILYYRSDPSDPWVQIGDAFIGNIAQWTLVENIILPNPSSTYQIAFEGIDLWGRANVLDDVQINGTYTGPPAEILLQNIELNIGDSECYAASQTISVAGSGTSFLIEDGATATLVAGHNILLLEGTWVKTGGSFHALIDTNGEYCNNNKSLLAVYDQVEGEPVQNDLSREKMAGRDEPIFNVYPNPTSGPLTIEIYDPLGIQGTSVEVFGAMGEKVSDNFISDVNRFTFDLAGKPAGFYIVKVLQGTHVSLKKVMKF